MTTKSKIERVGKKVILFGLFLFLFIPWIQYVTHFKKDEGKLDGAFYSESDMPFFWENWFSGEYQSQNDKYIKENFGFRNYYVRLICQLNFSLFKKASAVSVIVGKENYLYETAYFDAYYGRDFIGTQKIEGYIKKLKKIQDTLQKQNKLIFLIFAPGKASFYPEYIPESYKTKKKTTNYEAFIRSVKRNKVNHIDFYKYFTDQKFKSKYPLYPQLGIHWSDYGAIMAYDSIIKYTENKLSVNLPDLEIRNIEYEDSLRNTDDDAIRSLNLFKNPKTFKMAYPNWEIKYDSLRHKKLKLLVVSDSFWWYIYSTGMPNNMFASSRFWYYNEEMYPESHNSPLYVSQVDYASKIRQADIIIMMYTEATLRKFSGGFVDMCYETFYKVDEKKEKIQAMKEKISLTAEWFNQIKDKAVQRNISVDSMLTIDAIYMLEQEKK